MTEQVVASEPKMDYHKIGPFKCSAKQITMAGKFNFSSILLGKPNDM